MDDRALYAFPDVRAVWSVLSDTQRQLADQGYFVRLVFQQRSGPEGWTQYILASLRKTIEDSVGKFGLWPDVRPLPPYRVMPGVLTQEQARL